MANQELREALNDCMDRMASGQSISDCLRYYPEYAAALRPMLEVGSLVERAQVSSTEVAAAQTRVRARVNARLQARSARQSSGRLPALVASLLIASAALFVAAENSLPGDTLYNVKRFTENARSALIGQDFAARRLDEIRTLESDRRPADVEFSGQVERIAATSWRVAGLDVQVAVGTAGAASVVVDDTIRVSAYTTSQGDLVATAITLLNKTVTPLTVTATATPSPTATSTSTPTPSLTMTPTSTPIPLPTTCVPTMPEGWVSYIVQPGDTVAELAALTNVSVEQLLAVNCLSQTQMIVVEQTLFLPSLPPPTLSSPAPTQPPNTPEQPGVQPTSTDDHHQDGDGEGSDDTGGNEPRGDDD